MKADILLQSNFIFDGVSEKPYKGSIAIKDNKIYSITHTDGFENVNKCTRIYSLLNKMISPGFVDVHCFFAGHLLETAGVKLSDCKSLEEVISTIKSHIAQVDDTLFFLGRMNNAASLNLDSTQLNHHFANTSVIILCSDTDRCLMNQKAINTYNFTPETFTSENAWKLLQELLQNIEFSISEFKNYLQMMNSKGITSIKEMFFDDSWGFANMVENLAQKGELTTRVSFMSQPVHEAINFEFGKEMQSSLKTDFFSFSGYNMMTDGSISDTEAEMKEYYNDIDTNCNLEIDWNAIERDVLKADKLGFRFSLHAQGDAAVANSLKIFDKCQKYPNGKLVNHHAITDLECTDPIDLEEMGRIGVIAEVYPQIMSLAKRADKISMINRKIGKKRGRNYWNRYKLINSDVVISCATDLPLLYPDIPESIYNSVDGYFDDGDIPFNPQNTLQLHELLKAWSIGGQYNLGQEDSLGTIEVGKTADITVFDKNLFCLSPTEIKSAKVCLTIVDGKEVYRSL